MDDTTPLRQAAARAHSTSAFLYQPETTIRVDNDVFPGTPLFPKEPTAENPPNGAILAVELKVDGKQATPQMLTVVKDPRSPASQADLEQQFQASYKIFQDSLQSRRALAEINSVQEDLQKITSDTFARDVATQAAALDASIHTLLDGDAARPIGP